jgi:hypothetical protein
MMEYHVTVNLQKMEVISYFENVTLLEGRALFSRI